MSRLMYSTTRSSGSAAGGCATKYCEPSIAGLLLAERRRTRSCGAAARALPHRLRDREQRGHARGVVVRAEVACAEVIVVRADHDDVAADVRIAAGDVADDVRGVAPSVNACS